MLDIAILEGARTPFAKAFGPLAGVPHSMTAKAEQPARRGPNSPPRPDPGPPSPPARRHHGHP